ncbi:MAG: hypothetical protein WAO56_00435 [Miniphocaeibacter sp.]|uniref:hypothetical protein n=1 Tax=Miniphocaeibacter sp. TaxID=3100973 RepID=UPI0017B9E5EF|nr:hypothetical protein [Gallicola sp.]
MDIIFLIILIVASTIYSSNKKINKEKKKQVKRTRPVKNMEHIYTKNKKKKNSIKTKNIEKELSIDENIKDSIKENIKDSLSSYVELEKIKNDDTLKEDYIKVELLDDIKKDFKNNPKKAFIYSEIFNRKY